jgi:hypothetical protein
MHFFKSPNTLNVQSCRSIFNATKHLFNLILSQERRHTLSKACPCFVTVAALLGASLILRLLRGPFAMCIDREHGSTLYLAMTEFLKSCSIGKGDSHDRGATLAVQLWKSDRLFREPDGSIDTALCVRNNFAASLTADLVMRWGDGLPDQTISTKPNEITSKPGGSHRVFRATQ